MSEPISNFMGRQGFFLLPVLLALAGCAGNGEGLDENGQPISGGPPPNSDFAEIQATIFTPICTNCHIGANAPQGLRLDEANSYALLVNVASAADWTRNWRRGFLFMVDVRMKRAARV